VPWEEFGGISKKILIGFVKERQLAMTENDSGALDIKQKSLKRHIKAM